MRGKVRNVCVDGEYLRGLPVFVRDTPVRELHLQYQAAMLTQLLKPVSFTPFRVVMRMIAEKGRQNAGLSYHYMEHIDLISTLRQMFVRVPELFVCDNDSDDASDSDDDSGDGEGYDVQFPDAVRDALELAEAETTFATDFLRHTFTGSLLDEITDGFRCALYMQCQELARTTTHLTRTPACIVSSSYLRCSGVWRTQWQMDWLNYFGTTTWRRD
jgi:hypothetical protein